MKRMSWVRGVGRVCAGLLGAMVFACGPVSEEEAPDVGAEPEGVEEVTDSSRRPHREDTVPAPLALEGPNVAYGGGKYLVVWRDVRDGGLYATRVKQDGTVLDPEGLRLNTTDLGTGSEPAVAYDGRNFLVAWRSIDGLSAVRVSPEGRPLGPVFLILSTDDFFPPVNIACSSRVCMLAYEVTGDEDDFIHYSLVRTDGTVLVDTQYIGAVGSNASVAWDGREFLIVWEDPRFGGTAAPDIFGARVAPDGTVLDPDGGFPISVEPGAQIEPDVVWTGRRFLVVWQDERAGAFEFDIYGARVHRSGRVDDVDGIPISTAPGEQRKPHLAHHNSKSLVVWEDTREEPAHVWGARVMEDGEVADPTGFRISPGDFPAEFEPDVAYGGGRFLVTYAGSGDVELFDPHFIAATRVSHDTTVKDVPAKVLTREPREARPKKGE